MKKQRKHLCILLSLVMVFSLFNVAPLSASGFEKAADKATLARHINYINSLNEKFSEEDYIKAQLQKSENTPDPVIEVDPNEPVRVIVEVEGQTAVEMAEVETLTLEEASSKAKKQPKKNEVKQKAIKIAKVRHTYNNVLNGFSADVSLNKINELRSIPGVTKVTVATKFYPDVDASREMTKATAVWNQFKYKGEGTVIAILDTGIDYNHKDMKLTSISKAKLNQAKVERIISEKLDGIGKYYTTKVPFGYNYADENDEAIDTTTSMHGMHVAGISGANGEVKGVAPESQLLAMKVFSNNPLITGAYSDDIAAAIDDSVLLGADVVNMSLGSVAGFQNTSEPHQIAIKNATDAGTVVVVSAGNASYAAGPTGAFYKIDPDMGLVGSPGLHSDTIQVASVENASVTLSAVEYMNNGTKVLAGYTTSEIDPVGVLTGEYDVVDCGLGYPEDFAGKNVAGKVALISRGVIGFIDKKLNAQNAGAVGVIVYNNAAGYLNMATDARITIPSVFISQADGTAIKNAIADGIKLSFKGVVTKTPNTLAYQMADSTSWGSTPNLEFKPDLTAPGGNIYSTVNANKYQTMSGTSMAAPHASGAVALLIQRLKANDVDERGRDFVTLVKNIMTNSSEPLIEPSTNLPYLTRRQGSGLINIENAVKANAHVTDPNGNAVIALKEIGNTKTFELRIKNISRQNLTFTISDKYGVLTNRLSSPTVMTSNSAKIQGASVSFDKTEVTLGTRGQDKFATVKVTLNLPETTPTDIFAEGFITLTEKNGKSTEMVIPYMGYYGKWDSTRIFDAPRWDVTSMYKSSFATDSQYYYLGQTGAGPAINPDFISISPNGDGSFDDIIPFVTFLRNAREFKVQILDSSKAVVHEYAYGEYFRKHRAADTTKYRFSTDWTWNGKLLDQATGELKTAPEGQYYVRLAGKIDFAGANWNNLDIPVKVDITAPTIEIIENKFSEANKFKIKWQGSDATAIKNYYVFRNDTLLATLPATASEYVVPLVDGTNDIYLLANDYAGNFAEVVYGVDLTSDISLDVASEVITKSKDIAINYTINPLMVDAIKVIKATSNGIEIPVDQINKKVTTTVEQDGVYNIKITAYDNADAVMAEKTAKFIVDSTAPVINITDPATDKITTTADKYTLKFNVADSFTGYKLFVDGVAVDTVDAPEYTATSKGYEHAVNLPMGVSTVVISAIDFAGNSTSRTIEFNRLSGSMTINFTQPTTTGSERTARVLVVNSSTGALIGRESYGTDLTYNSTTGVYTLTLLPSKYNLLPGAKVNLSLVVSGKTMQTITVEIQ